jgi:hypothetical protein
MSALGAGNDPKPAGFNITSGFLPSGPIAKIMPMVPQDNNGFSGELRHRMCGIKQALIVPPFTHQRLLWEMIGHCVCLEHKC